MNSDATSQWPPPAKSTDSVRRKVVDVAAELMRGAPAAVGASSAPVFGGDSSDQSAMNLYLALLMDQLPVYARTLIDLESRVGEGSVEQNLIPAGLATIQFYCEILAAKVSVFTKPDQLVQLRQGLRSRDMGPQAGYTRVAAYLGEERRLGRIAADVDCDAAAQLLVGACLNYAFTKMLLDDVPPREPFVERAVRGLRLCP
ncbi:TetR/AcrR family transcriptional regulator C-terminal domain-containing protein [Actinomadura sp. DC4]|uniref:TetR/AcrR family transcriptional regulator C-terminal domain-containing protein n=1 Tax=Actinomadura sp. DC4 TaxID=3055069 RepID=UPI0025B0393E|nr:TetR/AcrR family transcriptional regulator C-terminal domain-containing protein [Actinomadura sp. DC4]MDN3352047.1 TetR/AcrR family transcriptional regulator C-terminal domain-containing protein [Actinomadura sp. DC4]